MARALRLDFPGAYHHVTSRIINSDFWLKNPKIKDLFLQLLSKTSLKFDTKVIAYCIMDNHFHLVLQSGKVQISKFMQTLLSSFALKYNYLTKRKGHVFESRFNSFLIEKESYLMTSIKYVLENPVRAGMVQKPSDYTWSSYNKYFHVLDHPMFNTATKAIVEIFNSKAAFLDYMEEYSYEKIESPKITNGIRILGDSNYIQSLLRLYTKERRLEKREISNIQDKQITEFILKNYHISKNVLISKHKVQKTLEARRVFAYLSKKYRYLKLDAIAKHLHVCSSSVSFMIQKLISDVLFLRDLENRFLSSLV